MATNIKFLYGTKTELPQSYEAGRLLFTTDEGHIYFDVSATQRVDLYNTDISGLKTLVGDTAVATQISNAINTLKTSVIGTPDASKTVVDMIKEIEQSFEDSDIGTLTTQVQSNKDAIDTLNGNDTKEGSVAKKIKDALETLKTELSSTYATKTEVNTVLGTSTDPSTSNTVYGAKKAAEEAKAAADAKVASVEAGDGIAVDPTSLTAPKVSVKIDPESNSVLSVSSAGLKATIPAATDYTISVTPTVASLPGGVAKRYTVAQENATGNTKSWDIDIPADMVVTNAEVVHVEDYSSSNGKYTDTDVKANGYYLKLTIANATKTELYVNLGALVDVYEGESDADEIQITVDEYTISATIVEGAVEAKHLKDNTITATKLADNAVTTNKVQDGAITAAKLDADLTEKIGGGLVWGTFSNIG